MDTINSINHVLSLPHISPSVAKLVRQYLAENSVLTKGEGNPNHVNAFFLPYDKENGKIYLGHHKKADDWIPPGGHIEPDETPKEACVREMQEELSASISPDQLELVNISYKYIGRPDSGCVGHYDLWYLVHIQSDQDFVFDPGEYYDAGWFGIAEGLGKIAKNPDFKEIISHLSNL